MDEHEQVNSVNEKWSIKNGVYTTLILNISNNYFPLFAISVLGVSNYELGLIGSLPQFVGMFAMILGSIIMNKLQSKKMFTVYSFLMARIFLLAMALVVFLPDSMQSWTFILLVALMNLPFSFANLSWQALIADIVSEQRRNVFFSTRNKVMTVVAMISTFIVGLFLQLFDAGNPLPYQLLFIFAFICGLLEITYLKKHIEPQKERVAASKSTLFGLSVFKHKPFLYFLLCSLFFNFAWQMCWSLFSIYQIKYAGATGLWVSLFAVANSIGQIVSFKWWGRMAEKHSHSKMLVLVSIGMATTPFMTVLSTNLPYIVAVNLLAGLFVSGTVLLLFNQLLDSTKEESRSQSISNYNILLALVAFAAPQFGVVLLEMTNIYSAMNISSVMRALSGVSFFAYYVYLKRKDTLPLKSKVAKIG
ncbi:MFS transporter [Niallia circulans]|uniref:MFS transporter n=1 Tax=Niallia circulans TaxID=1397 RepID=A0A553SMZ8_NIACI|nr:MFS transporter [Niallia circulans]TRZ38374.1 MFS transporter [Niallia circulans]